MRDVYRSSSMYQHPPLNCVQQLPGKQKSGHDFLFTDYKKFFRVNEINSSV